MDLVHTLSDLGIPRRVTLLMTQEQALTTLTRVIKGRLIASLLEASR
jgi:hypothetical protein